MLKKQKRNYRMIFNNLSIILIFCFSLVIFQFIRSLMLRSGSYSFFIEFNDANGVKIGTPIRMRGIPIGAIQSMKLKNNCVLVLAKINSINILINKDSIIETTQTGLLNESVIDILPLSELNLQYDECNNPLSSLCKSSNFICNNMYIVGDRGLNYDDLVRSTTRISQRFDDPRFFNLFYIFLQNSIEITDSCLELFASIMDTFFVHQAYIRHYLINDLF